MRETKTCTIKQIAKESGVSVATVSRVLNKKEIPIPISEVTRKRVLGTARNLNYRPNLAARNLRKKERVVQIGVFSRLGINIDRTSFVGRILHSLENSSLFPSIETSFHAYPGGNLEKVWDKFGNAASLSGVFVLAAEQKDIEFLDVYYPESLIPWILFHRIAKICPFVTCEETQATRDAVGYLAMNGHRKIVFFNRPEDPIGKERKEGFLEAIETHGLEGTVLVALNAEDGYQTARKVLQENRPDAVIATDFISLGVLSAIREKHMSIPEDISLLSFNNLSGWKDLTSIEEPVEAMTERGMELMRNMLGPWTTEQKSSMLPMIFKEGRSVRLLQGQKEK